MLYESFQQTLLYIREIGQNLLSGSPTSIFLKRFFLGQLILLYSKGVFWCFDLFSLATFCLIRYDYFFLLGEWDTKCVLYS